MEPLPEPNVVTCACCEREFDSNREERLRILQKEHGEQQFHLWPCGFLEKRFYERWVQAELFETPWEDEPREVWFCSDDCEQEYTSSGSPTYYWCSGCDRQISEVHPRSPYQVQFRHLANWGDLCLRCYEAEILEHGQPAEDFEGDSIVGGMFFEWGNPEPREAGFEEVEDFGNYFVRTHQDARLYNCRATQLIRSGAKVLTAYEFLAIGGLEGYVTLFARRGDDT